jgi:CarboxypepD_reg-like domain/Carboxypeptidase regulatory-like domain/TonB-dependent Receptor Plug Domain
MRSALALSALMVGLGMALGPLVAPAGAQTVSGAKSGANTAPGASGADNGASGQNAPAQAPMPLPGTAQEAAAAKAAAPPAPAANAGATGGGLTPGAGRPSSGLAATMPLLRAPPTLSGAYGIVVDSIHGGVLVGAVVTISGTDRQGITDSTGKFRIDSIPPGSYQLALFHPMLDSIGLAIGTNPIQFPAGRYAIVAIGTPSSGTLVASFCPPEKRITGNGLIVGRVTDADTDEPANGAKVSFTWSQLDVGKDIGVRHIPRTREAVVDATGSYHLCGIPERQSGTLRATTPTFTTADLPLDFSSGLVQIMTLHVSKPDTVTPPPPPPTVAAADTAKAKGGAKAAPAAVVPVKRAVVLRTGHATLTGAIYNSAAHGIPGVDVSVAGAASTTTTDSTGHFVLHNLPSGTQTLTLRKVGFAQKDLPVDISATNPENKIIRLDNATPVLAPVTVTAKWEQELKKIGFTDRQKSGLGRYQTREDIESKLPTYITDVFQTTPGIQVDYSSGQPVLKSSRSAGGGCVNYVIDGVPYKEQSPGDINDYMKPSEIEATEVYNAEETPGEFQQAGSTSCTTIVIWTKTRVGDFR